MKIVLSSLVFLFMITTSTNRKVADLNGEWSGSVQGQPIMLDFQKDGYLKMQAGNEIMDPYNYEDNGLTMISVYKTDFSKTPIEIDWMFVKKGTDEILVHREGIIEFTNDDTINVVMNVKGSRPTNFETGNVLSLNRVKK